MIFVDTSAWVDHLRGHADRPHVRRLRHTFGKESIVVGDLVMLEILQGAKSEQQAVTMERLLRDFGVVCMLDDALAVQAAHYYRRLRGFGVTMRRTIDMVIGTYCLRHTLPLLHNDRDFDGMVQHLGLLAVPL